ncbi:MAG: hypothetical protein HYZ45_00900 [Burkholderiales bacterium]|nr:hypothetical protein [Burkholderiales bacterium]
MSNVLHKLWQRLRPRLAHHWQAQLAFLAVGATNSMVLMRLPFWIDMIESNSWATITMTTLWQLFIGLLTGAVMLLIFHTFVEDGATIVNQPRRFLLVLAPASLAGSTISVVGPDMMWPGHVPFQVRPIDLLASWMEIMLWGGILIWLYCLYLQKQRDQLQFTTLLGKRAILARQLANSELLAARAQIDPQLLTRILRIVHSHHSHAPEAANALLDQLIAYLRMAMNRKRENDPSRSLQHTMDEAMQTMLASLHQLESQTP